MKELRTREEVLLGIVAGRDIDEKTRQMTPPLGASVTEELMLEIADKVNGGGSGSGGGSGGESGGNSAPLVVHLSGENEVADKTLGEIKEALETARGAVTVIVEPNAVGYYTATAVYNDGSSSNPAWYVTFVCAGNPNVMKPSLNENADLTEYPFFASFQ